MDNNNQNISGVNTQSEITQTDNIQKPAIGVDGITQTDSGKDSITQTNPTIIKDISSQTDNSSSTTDTPPILYNNTIKPHTNPNQLKTKPISKLNNNKKIVKHKSEISNIEIKNKESFTNNNRNTNF